MRETPAPSVHRFRLVRQIPLTQLVVTSQQWVRRNLCMSIFRAAIILAVSALLIAAGVFSFPPPSRAKTQEPQQTTNKSTKKARGQNFVPGEIIVRYRSESMAKGRTGAIRIAAQDGQLRSMRVDDFDGS